MLRSFDTADIQRNLIRAIFAMAVSHKLNKQREFEQASANVYYYRQLLGARHSAFHTPKPSF